MSILYNKTTMEIEWGAMLSSAKTYFETYDKKKHRFHQCLVLFTIKGEQIMCPINADSLDELKKQELVIIESLIEKYDNDTISKIVCLWENDTIDTPSFNFMKKISEINKDNNKAIILLCAGTNSYLTKQIKDIVGNVL